jgi:putative peptidoglycan lipid II flippase
MKKAALLVMIITILSKFLGFGRDIVLSYVYGASAITDAYLISQTIPTVIFSFISAGIATGFIPMYSRILKEQGELEADRFTSNLSNSLLILASIVVAFVLLFAEPVVKLFASGFDGETLQLATSFTRISVFGVYFTSLMNIFSGFLRLHNNYVVPALVGVPLNLVNMGALILSTKTNLYVLPIGAVLATAFQLVLIFPFVHRSRYRHQSILNPRDDNMRLMVAIALPVIVGTSVNEINVLVNRTLASGIAVGGISALNYAGRLSGFVQGLFVVSITTVMYPMIAKMAAEGNVRGLKKSISEAISIINLLVIPTTIGAMVFSKEIIVLLFGRGAFTPEAIDMTANCLFYYSIGMIAFGLRAILTRAFYALQDTKTPMINASIAVVLNIALNLILSRFLGLGGLALASSVSATLSVFLMFATLRRKIGSFGLQEIGRSLAKICLTALLMGVVALWSFRILKPVYSQNAALLVAIGVGALFFVVLIAFMKIPEVEHMLGALREKLGKRLTDEE